MPHYFGSDQVGIKGHTEHMSSQFCSVLRSVQMGNKAHVSVAATTYFVGWVVPILIQPQQPCGTQRRQCSQQQSASETSLILLRRHDKTAHLSERRQLPPDSPTIGSTMRAAAMWTAHPATLTQQQSLSKENGTQACNVLMQWRPSCPVRRRRCCWQFP